MGPNTIASRRLRRYQDEGRDLDESTSQPERKSVQGIVKPRNKKVKTEKKEEDFEKIDQKSEPEVTLDVKWDLLASNGGLGSVPKPDPFVPSREYDPPK